MDAFKSVLDEYEKQDNSFESRGTAAARRASFNYYHSEAQSKRLSDIWSLKPTLKILLVMVCIFFFFV
jgi:hypothetical protein